MATPNEPDGRGLVRITTLWYVPVASDRVTADLSATPVALTDPPTFGMFATTRSTGSACTRTGDGPRLRCQTDIERSRRPGGTR